VNTLGKKENPTSGRDGVFTFAVIRKGFNYSLIGKRFNNSAN